jgi:hypothetical protein
MAVQLFNVPDKTVLQRALAEREAYDVWQVLRQSVLKATDPEKSWQRKLACFEHPDVKRLDSGRVSAVRAPGAFQPFLERGVDFLPDTVKPKKLQYISPSQLLFMYAAWQRMAESFGLARAATLWCVCFDVPETVLQYVHKMGQRLEIRDHTLHEEGDAAGISALKKLKNSRKIYHPHRTMRIPISGYSGDDYWTYAPVKAYESLLKETTLFGLSFTWERGLSFDMVLNACSGSSARIKATESLDNRNCPAVAYVLCEEEEARALLRHGWPPSSFVEASEQDIQRAEIGSGPLESEGPWYLFYGA